MSERLQATLAEIVTNVAAAPQRGIWPLNEADTERLAVEPVLKALGYGPLDYRQQAMGPGADFPDYVVLPGSDRKWTIEVKPWDTALDERHERQAVNYGNNNGAQWAVLTNGRQWWVYNTRAHGNLAEMRIYEADINDVQAAAGVLSRLSRKSVEGGDLDREYRAREIVDSVRAELRNPSGTAVRALRNAVRKALDRDVSTEDVADALKLVLGAAQLSAAATEGVGREPGRAPELPDEGQWCTLSDLAADPSLCTGARAVGVTYGGSQEAPCSTWKEACLHVIKCLADASRLPRLPFAVGRASKRYYLNSEAVRLDGSPMREPRKIETPVGPVYVETHYSAHSLVCLLNALLEHVGEPPGSVRIRVRRG